VVGSRLNIVAEMAIAALAAPVLSCWPGEWPLWAGSLPPNFDILREGRAYRSAQPLGDELASAIEMFGIRTVVNLRGSNPGQSWYDAEVAACDAMGVMLADHAMSAQSLPSPELLEAITNTLLTARHPILIHCQAGADRTGAVSAIYRMLVLGHDKAAALSELSPVHLHLRAFTPCMDTLAELYEPGPEWLAEYGATVAEIVCAP